MTSITRTRMPALAEIADAWGDRADLHLLFPDLRASSIGWGEPFCFRCGWLAPVKDGAPANWPSTWSRERILRHTWNGASGWLERAHLRDHEHGGGEAVENLVPLCVLCHENQGQCRTRAEGLAFVNDQPAISAFSGLVQMVTDELGRNRRRPGKAEALRVMLRAQAIVGRAAAATQEAA